MDNMTATLLKFAEALIGVENDLIAILKKLDSPKGPPVPEQVMRDIKMVQLRAAATITKGLTREDLV